MAERAKHLAELEQGRLQDRTRKSDAMFKRAVQHMPLGVASSFQANDPYPVYLSKGKGAHVWDVDGQEYVDYHNGFGTMVVGHAHPIVAEAITKAAHNGTHFAVSTELTVQMAEELCRRFKLDQVRFTNSGTESTMDAIRLARGATGRDVVCKIEGSYHGHHDAVMFSVVPSVSALAAADAGQLTPMTKGIPAEMAKWTVAVPFNDAPALGRLFDERGSEIACLIMEPIMMNIGTVLPDPGYLEAVRELCTKHGVVLIFDEVKSGATVAPGGAIERFGVQPDLACFAKAIAGGVPCGAFGGIDALMSQIGDGGVAQQGTFNGNPLAMAAGVATLTQVLTPDAYTYLGALGTRLAQGCQKAIADNGIPAHAVDLGCKGCVSYRPEPLKNYRDFLETSTELFDASWPWLVNRGVFMTPGNEEQWTISVQHTDADIDRYVDAFTEFCAAVAS
jgi:glutamate-1-semialdehyde 2,1-aminomutase